MALDLVTKNPCQLCKPPKQQRKAVNALCRAERTRTMELFGVRNPDAFILGKQDPKAPPYHPTRLTREFTSFCRPHGFDCTFHDLRHTFATMLISDGVDIRTVASYLGHSNVALTLNTYAEVDPEAKRAAVGKIQDAFDVEDSPLFAQKQASAFTMTFTVEQLEAMLEEARGNPSSALQPASPSADVHSKGEGSVIGR